MTLFDRKSPFGWRVALLLLVVALLAAACGGDAEDTTTTTAGDTTTTTTSDGGEDTTTTAPPETTTTAPPEPATVSVRLDFLTFNGYHSPFHVADELGYYAEENLTVSIGEGQGSGSTAQLVSAGSDTFGLVVGTTIVDSVAQGLNIISVAQHLQFAGFCAIALEGSGIESPQDLEGKQIASSPSGASGPLIPAFLERHGLTDVSVVDIDPTTAAPALLEGLVDSWISAAFGFPVQFKEQYDRNTLCFPYRDVDVDPVGWGITANKDFVAENPDVVERFVRATMRGWQYTLGNPMEAAEITSQRVPTTVGPETGAASLQTIIDNDLPPWARDGLCYGEHEEAAWVNSLDLAEEYLGLERRPELTELYTNEFIPEDGCDWTKEALTGG